MTGLSSYGILATTGPCWPALARRAAACTRQRFANIAKEIIGGGGSREDGEVPNSVSVYQWTRITLQSCSGSALPRRRPPTQMSANGRSAASFHRRTKRYSGSHLDLRHADYEAGRFNIYKLRRRTRPSMDEMVAEAMRL